MLHVHVHVYVHVHVLCICTYCLKVDQGKVFSILFQKRARIALTLQSTVNILDEVRELDFLDREDSHGQALCLGVWIILGQIVQGVHERERARIIPAHHML